jgi:hypothetical protein
MTAYLMAYLSVCTYVILDKAIILFLLLLPELLLPFLLHPCPLFVDSNEDMRMDRQSPCADPDAIKIALISFTCLPNATD